MLLIIFIVSASPFVLPFPVVHLFLAVFSPDDFFQCLSSRLGFVHPAWPELQPLPPVCLSACLLFSSFTSSPPSLGASSHLLILLLSCFERSGLSRCLYWLLPEWNQHGFPATSLPVSLLQGTVPPPASSFNSSPHHFKFPLTLYPSSALV